MVYKRLRTITNIDGMELRKILKEYFNISTDELDIKVILTGYKNGIKLEPLDISRNVSIDIEYEK